MRALRWIVELITVVLGSCMAGFVIGTLQHYVAFGVWGDGFGVDSFGLALFEGGITGAIFGLPTGLLTYYVVLRRWVTVGQLGWILSISLVSACLLGVALFWLSAFLTPIVPICTAKWIAMRRSEQIQAEAARVSERTR